MKRYQIVLLVAIASACSVSVGHWIKTSNPPEACYKAQQAAELQCNTEEENRHYDHGDINYLRHDQLKEIPICLRIAEAALNGCRQ